MNFRPGLPVPGGLFLIRCYKAEIIWIINVRNDLVIKTVRPILAATKTQTLIETEVICDFRVIQSSLYNLNYILGSEKRDINYYF